MLRQPAKLRVRSGARKDLGISFCDGASALTFKRSPDHGCTTARSAGGDDTIDELDELVRQANGDLLAHPNMVADCYRAGKSEE